MCEICGGTGWVQMSPDAWPGDPNFGRLQRCQCRAASDAEYYQRNVGTPLLVDANLDNWLPRSQCAKEMLAQAEGIVKYPNGTWTIWGKNGNGKTTILMGVVNALLKQNIQAVYMTAVDLMEYVKKGIGVEFGADDRIRKLAGIHVLAIDELSQAGWTDYVTERLENLINLRYSAWSQGTKIATLVALDEPLSVLPARVQSRLRIGVVTHNTDGDMRPMLSEVER